MNPGAKDGMRNQQLSLDKKSQQLLDMMQFNFPLNNFPFLDLAKQIGLEEQEIIEKLSDFKEKNIIRRIGAVFDSKKLGYVSTLCALKVPSEKIEFTAKIINNYQQVTHNYVRSHAYNMWFTLTAGSSNDLKDIVAEIKNKAGIPDLIDLPAIRVFKIKVFFPMQNILTKRKNTFPDKISTEIDKEKELSLLEKNIVKIMQKDIPLCSCPFDKIAQNLGLTEKNLIDHLIEMKKTGTMRRFGAILYHRNMGFVSNAMSVWNIPEEKIEQAGKLMASFSEISHCYQRKTQKNWPYNLYAMIHGKNSNECENIAKTIAGQMKVNDYMMLYSTKELKKVSMQYFLEEEENEKNYPV